VTVTPTHAGDIANWDVEADVVIAGYGIAGVSAAIEAARAGADVMVLERTGGWGGAAALAGGFVYLGGGTPIQKACGFDDSVENMQAFLCAAMGPGADVTGWWIAVCRSGPASGVSRGGNHPTTTG
jgi:3-oxo-5alpha-steroid 4-dehydrogenase